MLKDKINSKKITIFGMTYITYYLFLILLLPSIVIYQGFYYIIKKSNDLTIFLSAAIYILVYLILEKMIYKKINIKKRIIISYAILLMFLSLPYVSFLLLFIPIMFLLRPLNFFDTLHFSVEMIKKHIFSILFMYIINVIVFSIIFSGVIIFKIQYFNIILTNKDEIFKYILKNASLLTYFSSINFAISSFLLYKNFEQNDIIRGDLNE